MILHQVWRVLEERPSPDKSVKQPSISARRARFASKGGGDGAPRPIASRIRASQRLKAGGALAAAARCQRVRRLPAGPMPPVVRSDALRIDRSANTVAFDDPRLCRGVPDGERATVPWQERQGD